MNRYFCFTIFMYFLHLLTYLFAFLFDFSFYLWIHNLLKLINIFSLPYLTSSNSKHIQNVKISSYHCKLIILGQLEEKEKKKTQFWCLQAPENSDCQFSDFVIFSTVNNSLIKNKIEKSTEYLNSAQTIIYISLSIKSISL